MPFSEVSLSSKKSGARYKEYGQTDTEDDILKCDTEITSKTFSITKILNRMNSKKGR